MAKTRTARRSGIGRNASNEARTQSRNSRALLTNIDEKELEKLEKETMTKVSQTLSALETAIVTWDTATKKPEQLRPKFVKYKLVHEVLARWQTKALKSMGKSTKLDERVGLLWEFVDICKTYV